MNQPENLHGDPPPTQGSHFQSINQVGRFADELHRQQKDVEAIFQTQGQQFASSIPVTPSSLYLQNSRSRGIETLGPRRGHLSAISANPQALIQPQQIWANSLAPNASRCDFDSFATNDQNSSTPGSVDWAGGFQSHLSNARFPELQDTELSPNGMRSVIWGPLVSRNMQTPQPAAIHYASQPYRIHGYGESGGLMAHGFAGPILDRSTIQTPDDTEVGMIHSSRSSANMQGKKRGHGEMANAGPIKTMPKRKRKGVLDKGQKDHANRVKAIGACAKCRKEHVTCLINPEYEEGPCLTCLIGRSTRLDRQLLCHRDKITDAVLFRNIVDSDYGTPPFSKTFNIGDGILKPFKGWDAEWKDVELTRGLGPTVRVRLRFLKAKALGQADIPERYRECPWALEDFTKAIEVFGKFIWKSISMEVGNKHGRTKTPLDQVAVAIFAMAKKLAERTEGRTTLLKEALMLWGCSRHIEGGWYFHGSETLGRERDNEGKVPLTAAPILDSEIASVIVKHHLPHTQKSVLENIQRLLETNNSIRRKHIFNLFLVYFILLHNCECMMKHQRKWAIHNNSPFRYTPQMMPLVKGILRTVNTILYVWRSDLKGQFPFNPGWNPTFGAKIAELSQWQLDFWKAVGNLIKGKEAQFNRLFQSWENYDEPYCFTGQLFVRDGHPFNSDWLPMDNMPERPLAPIYGPARP